MSDTGLMTFGFMLCAIFTGVLLALQPPTIIEVTITEPVMCKLDISEHPMGKLKGLK